MPAILKSFFTPFLLSPPPPRKSITMSVKAMAAVKGGGNRVEPFNFTPRDLQGNDVELEVTHCGVCASDVMLIDKMPAQRPFVPGHEVVGVVRRVGAQSPLRIGQRVGVGWQVGSCGGCDVCKEGNAQYCRRMETIFQGTHAATGSRNFGGFSERVVVDSSFAFALPDALPSPQAAPLLCAGLTVYSPLARFAKAGDNVGIVGIGGLGHLALQFAKQMGCNVTAISHSPSKEGFARELGAGRFLNSEDSKDMKGARGTLDFLLVTIAVDLDWDRFLGLMKTDGTACLVGVPMKKLSVSPVQLLRRVRLCGSVLASQQETRDMLTLAASSGIRAMVTELPMSCANESLDRVRQGKPRFRDVLVQDLSSKGKL